jgi:acyl carrier protein
MTDGGGHGGQTDGPASWEKFVAGVADIVRVDPADIRREARLTQDLGVDSLSLAELIVALVDEWRVDSVSATIPDRVWSEVTVGALYDEYVTSYHRAEPGGSQQSRPA